MTTTTLYTDFTTYWGDTLNGLWVTWSHSSAKAGDKSMGIKLTANLYAASYQFYLFGQTLNSSPADTAILASNAIAPTVGWNYCITGVSDTTCPATGVGWPTATVTNGNNVWPSAN